MSNENMKGLQLGSGHKSLSDENITVITKPKVCTKESGYIQYSIIEINSETESKEQLETSAKIDGGQQLIKINMGAGYTDNAADSKKLIKYSIQIKIITHKNEIDDESTYIVEMADKLNAITSLKGSELSEFYRNYGDSYINSIAVGGMIEIGYETDEQHKEKLKKFISELKIQALEVDKLKQTLSDLKEENLLNSRLIKSIRTKPSIMWLKADNFGNIDVSIEHFITEMMKPNARNVNISYETKPYAEHPALRANLFAQLLKTHAEKTQDTIKKLIGYQNLMERIAHNSTTQEYTSCEKISIPDITHDFYIKNKNQFNRFDQQIRDIHFAYKLNIYNNQTKIIPNINETIKTIETWFDANEFLCRFAQSHVLVHFVDPLGKKNNVNKCEFKGSSLPLINEPRYANSYIYIDLIGGNLADNEIAVLQIKSATRWYERYRGNYLYSINTKTVDALTSKQIDGDYFYYISTQAFLNKDIKLIIHKKNENKDTLEIIKDPCLLRIYLKNTNEEKLLGTFINPIKVEQAVAKEGSVDSESDDKSQACSLSELPPLEESAEDYKVLHSIGLFRTPSTKNLITVLIKSEDEITDLKQEKSHYEMIRDQQIQEIENRYADLPLVS